MYVDAFEFWYVMHVSPILFAMSFVMHFDCNAMKPTICMAFETRNFFFLPFCISNYVTTYKDFSILVDLLVWIWYLMVYVFLLACHTFVLLCDGLKFVLICKTYKCLNPST